MVRVSLAPEGVLDLSGIRETIGRGFFWRVLWFTTWQATLSAGLTLLVGLPLAYLFARFSFPGKRILRALTTVPFVMPTVVVAAAFTALLGPSGLFNRWLQRLFELEQAPIDLHQTIWLILLAHVFYNVSVIIRTVGSFWATLDPDLDEAAAVLGAPPWRRFREITLPLLLPSIAASTLLVFLFCFTSFGVILILGGLRFATLEVEIYRQAVNLFHLPVAAFLSIVQIGLTFIIMALYTRLQRRASVPLDGRLEDFGEREASGTSRIAGLLTLGATIILILPLLALVFQSVSTASGLSLDYYRALGENPRGSAFFVPPILAIRNSVLVAISVVLLSLLLGISSAYLLQRRRDWVNALLDPIFLLPLGTSAVTLGFGYMLAMGPLRTSLLLLPTAHTLIAAPFVVRTFLPALRSLNPHLREVAAVLGARPSRVWWEVDVPLLSAAALVGAVFAFTISLGEFGATLLISRPDFPTMPVVIYRALSRPGAINYGSALAMSSLLMLVAATGLLLIERFRKEGIGEL